MEATRATTSCRWDMLPSRHDKFSAPRDGFGQQPSKIRVAQPVGTLHTAVPRVARVKETSVAPNAHIIDVTPLVAEVTGLAFDVAVVLPPYERSLGRIELNLLLLSCLRLTACNPWFGHLA